MRISINYRKNSIFILFLFLLLAPANEGFFAIKERKYWVKRLVKHSMYFENKFHLTATDFQPTIASNISSPCLYEIWIIIQRNTCFWKLRTYFSSRQFWKYWSQKSIFEFFCGTPFDFLLAPSLIFNVTALLLIFFNVNTSVSANNYIYWKFHSVWKRLKKTENDFEQ